MIALEPLKDRPEAKRIASRASAFLADQRSPRWSWNYWIRGSDDDEKLPCPDDLDDTFAALEAIHIHAPELIDGGALASVVRILTAAEEKPGGPYNTWLVDHSHDPRWHDVDPVVNANVAAFLKGERIALPPVSELVERTIRGICAEDGAIYSKYYTSAVSALYFLSRSLDLRSPEGAALAECVADFLMRKRGPEGHWGTPVETACAMTALARSGASMRDLGAAVDYVLDAAEDGAWKPFGLYVETAFGGIPSYAGAGALSTAICLEALAHYKDNAAANGKRPAKPSEAEPGSAPAFSEEALELESEIVDRFKKRLGPETLIGGHGKRVMAKVFEGDKGKQVTLLPYFFSKSLKGAANREMDAELEELLVSLGLANLYGWIAYRIYDDFLDGEGSPELIPLAALCLREVTLIYARLIPEEHRGLYDRLMDGMDAANAWERASAYFPDRSFFKAETELPDFQDHAVLAEKSLPHCLGPAVLVARYRGGGPAGRSDVRATVDFFRHYIAARQLNDDAHDWQADLERGFVNSSATRILKSLREEQESSRKTFAFSELSERGSGPLSAETAEALQRIFWNRIMPGVAADVHAEIAAARRALVAIEPIGDLSYLESLLAPLEAAADRALDERKKMLSFLSEYGKSHSQ